MNREDILNLILHNIKSVKATEDAYKKEEERFLKQLKQLYALTLETKQVYNTRNKELLPKVSFTVSEIRQAIKLLYGMESNSLKIKVESNKVAMPLKSDEAPSFKKVLKQQFNLYAYTTNCNPAHKNGHSITLRFKLDENSIPVHNLIDAFDSVKCTKAFDIANGYHNSWSLYLKDEFVDNLVIKDIDPISLNGNEKLISALLKVCSSNEVKDTKNNPTI